MIGNNRRLELKQKSNTKEPIKLINYVKGGRLNKEIETKGDKIDFDEFSFEVASMVSEVFENEDLIAYITVTNKVLPTIHSDHGTLKYIFSEILKMCVKDAKSGTTVNLSIKKEREYCIFEFIYQNGEKDSMDDKWKESLCSVVKNNKGTLSIKEKKDTYTFICLLL